MKLSADGRIGDFAFLTPRLRHPKSGAEEPTFSAAAAAAASGVLNFRLLGLLLSRLDLLSALFRRQCIACNANGNIVDPECRFFPAIGAMGHRH